MRFRSKCPTPEPVLWLCTPPVVNILDVVPCIASPSLKTRSSRRVEMCRGRSKAQVRLGKASAPRACAPPCCEGPLNGSGRVCAAEGRMVPARTRTPGTPGSHVNPWVGRELKPFALLLRLMPPTPGSSKQNSEHSALESNCYIATNHIQRTLAAAIIRIDLRLPSAITGVLTWKQ